MNRLHRWYCRSAHWQSTLDRLVPWGLGDLDLGDHVLELGPGGGLVTRRLATRTARVTAIDCDCSLAGGLRGLPGVRLVCGDAAQLPFASRTFSAVVAFTMLHHVPTADRQQCLFREASRTLRPGGVFVGVDPRSSLGLRFFHLRDTFVPIPPHDIGSRLAAAGFDAIDVDVAPGYVKFGARSRVDAAAAAPVTSPIDPPR
jgi:SAM-dependent methyltransferase